MNRRKERSEFLKWLRDLYPLMGSRDEEAVWMFEGWMTRAKLEEQLKCEVSQKLNIKQAHTYLNKYEETRQKIIDDFKRNLIGKKVIINDKSFNGQPLGKSRKSMYGKSFKITKNTFINHERGKLYIQVPNTNACIDFDKLLVEGENVSRKIQF